MVTWLVSIHIMGVKVVRAVDNFSEGPLSYSAGKFKIVFLRVFLKLKLVYNHAMKSINFELL